MRSKTKSHVSANSANQSDNFAFIICLDSVCEGRVALVFGDNAKPFTYPTRQAAQRDIADDMIVRLQEFISGQREFSDATSLEEFVVQVRVLENGCLVDEDGIYY